MRLLSEIRERGRALLHRASNEREMEEELRFHLDMQAEEYVRRGMHPAEARRQAVLDFGGVERVKEEVRDARGLAVLESVAHDVGYALRSFRSGRSGLLISMAVLATAIGAGTSAFSIASGVLLNSLPFREPDRLVQVGVSPLKLRTEGERGATLSAQSLALALSPGSGFESAAYLYGAQPVLTGQAEPQRLRSSRVAPEFFGVLGARPLLGRTLTADDAQGGASVVLSHRFWAAQLGKERGVVGRTLLLDGVKHDVVGVMPPGFEFPERTQIWQPAPPLHPAPGGSEDVQGRFSLVARLAPGISPVEARARLDARFAAHGREQPGFAAWGAAVMPVRELVTGEIRRPLILMMGAVALVILTACANVAAVLLARGVMRRRELGIRVAVGATRGRVARQLVTEAVLLALFSGAAGTLLAMAGVPILVSLAGDQIPSSARIGVDGRVLVATLAASTLTGLVAGIFPALLMVRAGAALRDGSPGAGTRSWRTRAGEGLVVTQVGLGTILLTAAALLGATFVNLLRVDLGFDPEHVAVAELKLPAAHYGTPDHRRIFIDQVLERAAAIPGVRSAAVSSGIPLDGGALGSVEIPGREVSETAPVVWFTDVTPDYFRTMGIALLRGREIAPGERREGVWVNESLVRSYFGGRDPIGQTLVYYDDQTAEVVGVVADARQNSLAEPPPPQLYAALDDGSRLKVSIRTRGDAASSTAMLAAAIRSVDPGLPIDRVAPLEERVRESVARPRFYAAGISAFALIALLITTLGIYGLASYSVSRRGREIGIRLALGATARDIYRTTVGRAALLAGAGVALGLAGARGGAAILEAFVFGLSTSDPRIFAGVALLLTLAAVLAALAPARRAGRIDPVTILRAD